MTEWWQHGGNGAPLWTSRAWVFIAIRLLADEVVSRRGERIVAMCPNPGGMQ